jgi:hypothetical protein
MIFRDGASDMEFLERSVFRVRAFSRDQRAIDCYQMRNGLPGAAKHPGRPFHLPDEIGD